MFLYIAFVIAGLCHLPSVESQSFTLSVPSNFACVGENVEFQLDITPGALPWSFSWRINGATVADAGIDSALNTISSISAGAYSSRINIRNDPTTVIAPDHLFTSFLTLTSVQASDTGIVISASSSGVTSNMITLNVTSTNCTVGTTGVIANPNPATCGSISTISCATGYTGNSVTASCQADGSFNATTTCSLVTCQGDTSPGVVTTPNPGSYGSTSTISCATGYTGNSVTATCQADTTFNATTTCSLVTCQGDTSPGVVTTPNPGSYGNASTISCATGYTGNSVTASCQADGTFSATTTCSLVCSPVTTPGVSTVMSTSNCSSQNSCTATLSCGYCSESVSSVCQSDGTFAPQPICRTDCDSGLDGGGIAGIVVGVLVFVGLVVVCIIYVIKRKPDDPPTPPQPQAKIVEG